MISQNKNIDNNEEIKEEKENVKTLLLKDNKKNNNHLTPIEHSEINAGCLVKIEGNQIFHYVTTFKGSSGSPIILLLRKYKIIGIHCAASEKLKMNRGIKMKDILDDIKKVK